jgi:hypothetical protein
MAASCLAALLLRRRVTWCLFVLVAVAVLGYVLGATAWLGLLPWSR